MSTTTTRNIVIILVSTAWLIGILVAAVDGTTVLRATTPVLTMMFGWLFAARASA